MEQPYHHGDLRQALLDAAERILDRDGIEALSLRAVAREAGVTHGSPRHHFAGFASLLSAVATRGFERLTASMKVATRSVGLDDEGRLPRLGQAYVRFATRNRGLFLLMFRSGELDQADRDLRAAGEAAFAMLAGDAPDRDETVRAISRWAHVHGLAMLAIDGRLGPAARRAEMTETALLGAALDVQATGGSGERRSRKGSSAHEP